MAHVANNSRPGEVQVDKLTYAAPLTMNNGCKIIRLMNDSHPLVFQTPAMYCPWGASSYDGEKGAKFTMGLNLDEKAVDLKNMLEALDERLIQDGLDNSLSWFKKKITSAEVLKALYAQCVKYSRDKNTGEISTQYAPQFKVQLPMDGDKLKCDVFNKNMEKQSNFDVSSLRGSTVVAIVQCNGVWIAGGKFGCGFKVLKMIVTPNSNNLRDYAFLDDERVADFV